MTKNELIEKLQSIEGNPVVLLSGEGSVFLALRGVKLEKMHQSKSEPEEYVDDYVNYLSGNSTKYDKKEFERIYQYSTLQYFHKELGIK